MKILVTGAKGSLGQDIVDIFRAAGHEVIQTDREELDITNREQVLEKVGALMPEVIINTAAYNFVDNVEDPEFFPIAYQVNAEGPRNLALAAKTLGIPFVHYSTDYVFSGDKLDGYEEDDQPRPISKYGETKWHGETLVERVGGKYYICRLSKIFGRPAISENGKESFVSLMIRLAKEKPELKIVNEEVGSPSYTLDIARATLQLLADKHAPGIYHIVNEGRGVTWFDFAEEIFALAQITTPRFPVTSAEFPKPAMRPKFAALKNTKLPRLRSRQEALAEYIKTL
ncbi:MAG: dTDP-4-dehydrorhamnose reductase [Patescibacteria group bacterium]|nr:dTDP-4-dehydrorhamnose reductase [Patescibacteria group bacterium]